MMKERLENLRDLKQKEFRKNELSWLKTCVLGEIKKGISKENIIFTANQDTTDTYLRIPRKFLKNTPSRFLKSDLVVKSVPGKELEKGIFVKLELLYWVLENIEDIWGFMKLMDPLFYEVFHGEYTDYDESEVGYRVLDKHLKKVSKGWNAIKKTLFIGYLCYKRLLQKSTVPTLATINEGLKDKTLNYFGLTIADKQAFGKVTHRTILGVCWNCGDTIEDVRSGLCIDCFDYWDEKTR